MTNARKHKCVRCGREWEGQMEAMIDGKDYCHPAMSIGRTCFTEQSYEMAFRR